VILQASDANRAPWLPAQARGAGVIEPCATALGKRVAQSTIIHRSSEAQAYNGGVRYGIIADDLAGSCDVAGRLTLLGYRPIVYVSPVSGNRSLSSLPQGAVVIINTRSRDGSLREAVARAQVAARLLERSGAPVIYQKMDSTLRGHWAEEMKSIARVIHPEHVFMCPAFPAQGRFVRDGHLRVLPGPYLDFGAFMEVREGLSLRARTQRRCGWEALEIPRCVLRRGPRAIRAEVLAGTGTDCVVFDAARDADLQAMGRAFRKSTARLLWVGSAGLVPYVIPPLFRPESAACPRRRAPWLFIQGSQRALSRNQFLLFAQARGVDAIEFSPIRGSKEKEDWCARVIAALGMGRDVAVLAPEEFDVRVRTAFPRFLNSLLRAVLRHAELGGVFVSGGRTAEAVCDSLRVKALRVIEEVRPGIAASLALDGRCPGLCLVTKAGGFGSPQEVREILEEYVRARS